MAKKTKELTQSQKKIIENVSEYISKHSIELNYHYLSVKTDNGQNRINNIYEVIDNETYNTELLKVSVVILTANYYECEILNLNAFNDSQIKIKQLRNGLQLFPDRYIVKAYIMKINDYMVLHLHAPETGSNTPCGSSDLVRYVKNCKFVDPSCIISFGICYGTDFDTFSLGDTLIAEKIYPWSIGLKINDDGWKIKCDDYVIDLRKQDPVLFENIQEVMDSTQQLCPDQIAKVGNMLSAEAVVSNEKVKIEAIQNAYGCNIIGGEMEGYGLAKECIYYNKIPCVILKAICDWGAIKNIDQYIDEQRVEASKPYKDQIQAYTTYCAYRALKELFINQVFKRDNLILSIHDELMKNYYSDGSIEKKLFSNFIEKYLKDKYPKYSNMSDECQRAVKNIVVNSIIKLYFRPFNKGYIFKEHLI